MLTKTQLEQYHEDGYVIPGLPPSRREHRGDPRGPRPAAREAPGVPQLLPERPRVRPLVPQPRPDPGRAGHGGADPGAGLRPLELELLRQAGRQRPGHPLAPGRRVLADPAARDLHGVDRGRRRDPRERVPALHPRLAPRQASALPPHQLEPRSDPQPGAQRHGVRRVRGGGPRAGSGPDLAPRRVSRPRLRGEPVPAAPARHDPSLHADDVGVRPGDGRPAPPGQGDGRPAPARTPGQGSTRSWTTPTAPCS